jgi:hypothetical protein
VTGGRPRSSSGRVGAPSLPAGAPLFPRFLEVGQTAPNQVDFPPQGDLTIPRTQNPTTQTPEGKGGWIEDEAVGRGPADPLPEGLGPQVPDSDPLLIESLPEGRGLGLADSPQFGLGPQNLKSDRPPLKVAEDSLGFRPADPSLDGNRTAGPGFGPPRTPDPVQRTPSPCVQSDLGVFRPPSSRTRTPNVDLGPCKASLSVRQTKTVGPCKCRTAGRRTGAN